MKVESPARVNINVERAVNLTKTAFNTIAFFTEVDHLEDKDYTFTSLGEVLESGFTYGSPTYNFCRGVFLQRGDTRGNIKSNVRVIVRLKRKEETYLDCYKKRDNSEYYFISIESKAFGTMYEFNTAMQQEDKLHMLSTSEVIGHMIAGHKVVYYWQPNFSRELLYDSYTSVSTDSGRIISLSTATQLYKLEESFWMFDGDNGVSETSVYLDDSGNKYQWDWYEFVSLDNQSTNVSGDFYVAWDEAGVIPLDSLDATTEQEANSMPLYYPEAAWFGRCGGTFPSRTQWLYKTLEGVEGFTVKEIPLNANTSTYINGDKVTLGTGCTAQGVRIEQQVFLDWLKWAIQQNMWNLLYVSEKVPATQGGLTLMEQRLDEVLRYSVAQQAIPEYRITERKYDKVKVSFKFRMTLLHSILGVDVVEGTVTH